MQKAARLRSLNFLTLYFYCSELSGINMQRLLHGVFVLVCWGCGVFHGFLGLDKIFGKRLKEHLTKFIGAKRKAYPRG